MRILHLSTFELLSRIQLSFNYPGNLMSRMFRKSGNYNYNRVSLNYDSDGADTEMYI